MPDQEEFNEMVETIKQRSIYPIQKFMFVNNVISASTSYTIGAITKDMIIGILDNTIHPIISFIGKTRFVDNISLLMKSQTMWASVILDHAGNIMWWIFLWLATTLLSYFVLEHIFNRVILKMNTTVPDDEMSEFIRSNFLNKNKDFSKKTYDNYINSQLYQP